MDKFVCDLLTSWKLEKFIERFEEAGIDEEIFVSIDDSMLNKLFKVNECGFQHKFVKRFEIWKSTELSHRVDDDYMNITSLEQNNKANHNNDSQDPFADLSNTSLASNKESSETNTNNASSTNSKSNINDSNSNLNGIIDLKEVTEIAVVRRNINDLLHYETDGKIVRATFVNHKRIDFRLLSDIVIKYEFAVTSCYRIRRSRFIQLSVEASGEFSTEEKQIEPDTFYYPYQPGRDGKKGVSAGGCFYDKYLSIRKKLIQAGVISKSDRLPQEITTVNLQIEKVEWLKVNDKPKQEVESKWFETFEVREQCSNALVYLLRYQCLRSDFSYLLLANDFDRVYPEKKLSFTVKWPAVSKKIWLSTEPEDSTAQPAKRRKKSTTFTTCDENLVKNNQLDVLAFFCLNKVLATPNRKRKNLNDIDFQTQLYNNSFIFVAESSEVFREFHQKKVKYEAENNITEPYIAYIGKLEDNGTENIEIFILIGNVEYKIDSRNLVDAVNYCFKCYVILNLDFPNTCKPLWSFFARYLFDLPVLCSKPYVSVLHLIETLSKMS